MSGLRVLALAGAGTSAEVWQIQSQSFRSLLPQTWRYHFVNGEEPCLPADGIEDVYPEPFFCYYDVPSFENVEAAHELIHEILEDEGPFDAVLAYSQGAALAASIILHHQAENPYGPPLFRFAVFMNASLPYSKNTDFGIDVGHMWYENCLEEGRKVITPTDDDTAEGIERYGNYLKEGYTWRNLPIRRFSPSTHTDKINIPTAHIYGQSDPHRPQSLRLIELCDEKQAASFEHVGGHEVPRSSEQSKEIFRTINKTYQKAQFIIA